MLVGRALTLTTESVSTSSPSRRFYPTARLTRAWGRISPLLGGHRSAIAVLAIAAAVSGLAEAGVLALVAHIATTMSGAGLTAAQVDLGPVNLDAPTSFMLGAAGALAVLRFGLQLLLAYLPARLAARVQGSLRRELFDSYSRTSWTVQAQEREGHVVELVGAQVSRAGMAVLQLANGIAAGLAFAILLAAAVLVSLPVALVVTVTAAVLFAALRPLSRRVRRHSAASSAAALDQARGVAEAVRLAEETQVFGTGGAQRAKVRGLVARLEDCYRRTRALSRTTPAVYQSAVIFLVVGGLALLYAIGTTRFAALGAVVLMLVRASAYGQQLQTAYQALGEALPYVDRVRAAIDRYNASVPVSGSQPIPVVRTIAFHQVSYSYRAGEPVLSGLNFEVNAGEAIGVVGPTGAGKSTLVQLLLRLRIPSEGSYLVNGIRSEELSLDDWHRKVAYVPQQPAVLDASVADNIRFMRARIDDAALERAARLAHIHAEIETWAKGYETVIGQRADAVSGGQRQRLCLARALAGEPELLVLDEPTSALDLHSERLVQQSLDELRGQLTLFVVAHRLSTLGLCDRVMVIREGRLEAFEPAAALYESNSFYRQAVDLAGTSARK